MRRFSLFILEKRAHPLGKNCFPIQIIIPYLQEESLIKTGDLISHQQVDEENRISLIPLRERLKRSHQRPVDLQRFPIRLSSRHAPLTSLGPEDETACQAVPISIPMILNGEDAHRHASCLEKKDFS